MSQGRQEGRHVAAVGAVFLAVVTLLTGCSVISRSVPESATSRDVRREPARPADQSPGEASLQALPADQPVTPAGPATPSEADPEVAELIRRLYTDSASERKATREAILDIGPERTVSPLLAIIEDPSFMVRWKAVNLLGYLADKRAVDPLIDRAVLDVNPHVRWRALWALAVVGDDEKITAEFQRRLSDESQRWNSAVGLSMFSHPAAIPTLTEGLESQDSWIRFEAVFGLGRSHDENTSTALVRLLEGTTAKTRREVAMSLGRIGDGPAVDGLVFALRDPEPGVRWRAAMGLKLAGDPRAAGPLARLLEGESDANVRKHALEALEKLQGSAAGNP